MKKSKLIVLREMIEKAATSLIDEDAIEAAELFPAWDGNNIQYVIDTRLQYKSKLYRVTQTHTSQFDWPPDTTPALYTEIAKPGEIPVWRQPTGAQDAYMIGDKVYYPTKNESIYESEIDNNVWEPTLYGWKKL